MTLPLMPKATAVWLIENTSLTFEQIAAFCGMHALEVQSFADEEVATHIVGHDPIISGQLTADEIKRCEQNTSARLQLSDKAKKHIDSKKKTSTRYTPVARRQDKPDAISWLLKNCPNITDAQIVRLIGTTKNTITAIRNKAHWNMSNIRPRDPVLLALCSQTDLDHLMHRLRIENGETEA